MSVEQELDVCMLCRCLGFAVVPKLNMAKPTSQSKFINVKVHSELSDDNRLPVASSFSSESIEKT